jgi:hypothetical protein
MKKILKYISLLAGVAFLTAACSQSDIDGNASEEMGTLRLSVNIGGVPTHTTLWIGVSCASIRSKTEKRS